MENPQLRDCSDCPHRGRQIYLIGAHRFSVDVLASFIGANTPARCEIVERLRNVPPLQEGHGSAWRLLFFDCLGLTDSVLLERLQRDGAPFTRHDVLALFNLAAESKIRYALLELGVRGFFYQNDPAAVLLKGICALNRGEVWVSRDIVVGYCNSRTKPLLPESCAEKALSRREEEVLRCIARGDSTETIARNLFISTHTVKSHTYNIFRKIGVPNRLQAALWAARHLR